MLHEPDLTPLPKSLDWECVSLGRGETLVGILCGRVRKFACHTLKNGQSKPCLKIATRGALPCWCEQTKGVTRNIVYVPIVTREGEQVVVRMSAVQGHKAEAIKAGTLVEFTRPDRAKRPTFIKPMPTASQTQNWVMQVRKNTDADILEYLCHLWQLHALTKYCGFACRRSLQAATTIDLSEPEYMPRFTHTEKLLAEKPTNAEAA